MDPSLSLLQWPRSCFISMASSSKCETLTLAPLKLAGRDKNQGHLVSEADSLVRRTTRKAWYTPLDPICQARRAGLSTVPMLVRSGGRSAARNSTPNGTRPGGVGVLQKLRSGFSDEHKEALTFIVRERCGKSRKIGQWPEGTRNPMLSVCRRRCRRAVVSARLGRCLRRRDVAVAGGPPAAVADGGRSGRESCRVRARPERRARPRTSSAKRWA